MACLKNINMFLYVAMLVIATLGPMGPMNSFYGATSRIMLAMGRKGQLPDSFAVLDEKSGAPKMANTVLAVLTIMGPFLGKNMLVSLTNVSALAFIFSCTMVSFACLKMRYTEPDLPRPYKVPGGKAGICMACLAGTIIIGLMVVPFSPAALKPVEWAIVVAGWSSDWALALSPGQREIIRRRPLQNNGYKIIHQHISNKGGFFNEEGSF